MRRAPKGTVDGTLRWFVHREYLRPTRLGEKRPTVVWVVTPIVGGRGSLGIRYGSHTVCASRRDALRFAHRQAQRTYGPRKDRS